MRGVIFLELPCHSTDTSPFLALILRVPKFPRVSKLFCLLPFPSMFKKFFSWPRPPFAVEEAVPPPSLFFSSHHVGAFFSFRLPFFRSGLHSPRAHDLPHFFSPLLANPLQPPHERFLPLIEGFIPWCLLRAFPSPHESPNWIPYLGHRFPTHPKDIKPLSPPQKSALRVPWTSIRETPRDSLGLFSVEGGYFEVETPALST